jgi:hypothetical protein
LAKTILICSFGSPVIAIVRFSLGVFYFLIVAKAELLCADYFGC